MIWLGSWTLRSKRNNNLKPEKPLTITRRSLTKALASLPFFAGACASTGDGGVPGRPYHHTSSGFRNPKGSPAAGGDFSDWTGFFWRGATRDSDIIVPPDHVLSPDAVRAGLDQHRDRDRLTWLGHASFLLRQNGLTIVTDPYLSDYASPIPPLGPKRFVPPALRAQQLPPIDLLLLSHNHYDHLDIPSLEHLPLAPDAKAIVPLGLTSYVNERGFSQVFEVDWHDRIDLGGLTVTALPAIHMSKRGLFDRNRTLWTGYGLRSSERHLYFSGDTAFGPVFKEMAKDLDAFDVGLVPIGAYEPRLLMRQVHTTPEEGVKIGQDLGIKRLVGMHWGTIQLTDEPLFEPPGRFREAAKAAGYDDQDIWVMKIGETRAL